MISVIPTASMGMWLVPPAWEQDLYTTNMGMRLELSAWEWDLYYQHGIMASIIPSHLYVDFVVFSKHKVPQVAAMKLRIGCLLPNTFHKR